MFSKTRGKSKSGDNTGEGEAASDQPAATRRRKPASIFDTDEFITFGCVVSGMLLIFK